MSELDDADAIAIAAIIWKHCRPEDDDKAIDAAREIIDYVTERFMKEEKPCH